MNRANTCWEGYRQNSFSLPDLGIVETCRSVGNVKGWSGAGLWLGGGIYFHLISKSIIQIKQKKLITVRSQLESISAKNSVFQLATSECYLRYIITNYWICKYTMLSGSMSSGVLTSNPPCCWCMGHSLGYCTCSGFDCKIVGIELNSFITHC